MDIQKSGKKKVLGNLWSSQADCNIYKTEYNLTKMTVSSIINLTPYYKMWNIHFKYKITLVFDFKSLFIFLEEIIRRR